MRRLVGPLMLLALIACEPVAQPTTTTDPPLPPPDPVVSTTTTTTNSPTTTQAGPSPHFYRGILPDGADFDARVRGIQQEEMMSVRGTFSYMTDDGPIPVGEVRFARVSDESRTGYFDGVLNLWLEPWYVDVIFSEAVLEAMGEDAEGIVTRSIRLDIQGQEPWPILNLSSPFTWEGGDPQIWWETFVIASGCGDVATFCTENRVVQLVSMNDIIEGEKGLTLQQIDGSTITTSSTRKSYDSHYLDPGPLDRRRSADLIWTGKEMIVWGGKQTRDGLPTLVDGAAFNPLTNEWRRLARFPLQGPVASRGIWADDEMIVVSHEGTFGYDPEADAWRTITSGVVPSEWHDRMLYADGMIYVWARRGLINILDLSTGEWRLLEVPESFRPDPFFGVLRHVGDGIVAIVLGDSRCSGKSYYKLDGDVWLPLDDVYLSAGQTADCSLANQSASLNGDLIVWEEEGHPSAVYESTVGAWREIHPIPLGGMEGTTGPIEMDADHFLVPRWDEAAIFDASTESWTRFELPGVAADTEMIWTGEELLAWGIFGSFDAWRWTPPQAAENSG